MTPPLPRRSRVEDFSDDGRTDRRGDPTPDSRYDGITGTEPQPRQGRSVVMVVAHLLVHPREAYRAWRFMDSWRIVIWWYR